MQEEGFSYGEVKRIFTSIGLAIGGKTPGEIAISIAAEMIKKEMG